MEGVTAVQLSKFAYVRRLEGIVARKKEIPKDQEINIKRTGKTQRKERKEGETSADESTGRVRPIDVNEIKNAETEILRYMQGQSFQDEQLISKYEQKVLIRLYKA